MPGATRPRRVTASLVLVVMGAVLASGCIADNAGFIFVWSENKGGWVYGDEFVAPGTRFRLEFREDCSSREYCDEDPVRIEEVTVDGTASSLAYLPDSEMEEQGDVVFEAGSSGRASVTIEYENSGETGVADFTFQVEEPETIVLRQCENSHLLEAHPRVDLLHGYLRGGERMLAGGLTDAQDPYAPRFSPPGAVALADDDSFYDTFRVIEEGGFTVTASIDLLVGGSPQTVDVTPRLDAYSYAVAPIDVVQSLETESTISDIQDGQAWSIAVDVMTDRTMCVEPAFYTRVLTPDVCRLHERRASEVEDPNAFWTHDGQLSLVSVSEGTCRLALSVPGGDDPVVYREIEAELSH